jgi:uncharacterized protein
VQAGPKIRPDQSPRVIVATDHGHLPDHAFDPAVDSPSWRNEVTLRSVEMFTEYEPGSYISFISPTPLLLVVALGDHLTVADEALAAYERALEPKKLVMLSGGHFDAYVKDFELASAPARDWFVTYLKKR